MLAAMLYGCSGELAPAEACMSPDDTWQAIGSGMLWETDVQETFQPQGCGLGCNWSTAEYHLVLSSRGPTDADCTYIWESVTKCGACTRYTDVTYKHGN